MKKIFLLIISLLLLGSVVGCEQEDSGNSNFEQLDNNIISSDVLAENDSFSLYWDSENKCVLLKEKSTEYIWSSVPQSYYESGVHGGRASVVMESPLIIEYIDPETGLTSEAFAYNSVYANGSISTQVIENGIEVIYGFDDYEISIPVQYTLQDDSLQVSIEPTKIKTGQFDLYSISVSPYMCSVVNNAGEDSYLFVPSGSGALIYSDERAEGKRVYSEEVYGRDYSREVKFDTTNEKKINLPVFGVKNDDRGIIGVIDSGDGQALIEAEAGNKDVGYSSVYVTYFYKGYDAVELTASNKGKSLSKKQADGFADNSLMSVTYYPLEKGKSSYVDMAHKYYEVVSTDNEKASIETVTANIDFYGGIEVYKNLLGVSYDTLTALTSFNDVSNIIQEIAEQTDTPISANLVGFGKDGVSKKLAADGIGIAKVYGDSQDLQNLITKCQDSGITLYRDFDITNYSKTSSGVSTRWNSTKNVLGTRAYQYIIDPYLRSEQDGEVYYLVNHEKVLSLLDKVVSRVKKDNISGVSLSSFADITYSDYTENKGYARADIKDMTSQILNTAKENNLSVMLSNANGYAAIGSDIICDTPLSSSKKNIFDKEVPFYQIAFHGSTVMTGESLNTSDDMQKTFLKCMDTGISLQFSVIENYTKEAGFHTEYDFYAMKYDDCKEDMISYINESKEFLNQVYDSKIVARTEIENGVYKTDYSNGISIVVNYNETSLTTVYGELGAEDYIIVKGEGQ